MFEWYHAFWLGLAVILDVIANVMLKYSNGFQHRLLGFGAIFLVLLAFTALSFAVEGIDLSLAYAIWGGFGIMATVALGWIVFHQRLNAIGWLGLAVLILGMNIIKLA